MQLSPTNCMYATSCAVSIEETGGTEVEMATVDTLCKTGVPLLGLAFVLCPRLDIW